MVAIHIDGSAVEDAVVALLKDELPGIITEINTASSDDPELDPVADARIEVFPGDRDDDHPPTGPASIRVWVVQSSSTGEALCIGVDRVEHDLEVRVFCDALTRVSGGDPIRLQTALSRRCRRLARAVQIAIQRGLLTWPDAEVDSVVDADGSGRALGMRGRPNGLGIALRFQVFQKIYSGHYGANP